MSKYIELYHCLLEKEDGSLGSLLRIKWERWIFSKKKVGRDGIQVNRRKDRNFGVKWPKIPTKTLGFRKNNQSTNVNRHSRNINNVFLSHLIKKTIFFPSRMYIFVLSYKKFILKLYLRFKLYICMTNFLYLFSNFILN